tara:strand:- start:283 stop:414 length:132 start_codon:yes stop_codon:yes gene_type:complete
VIPLVQDVLFPNLSFLNIRGSDHNLQAQQTAKGNHGASNIVVE